MGAGQGKPPSQLIEVHNRRVILNVFDKVFAAIDLSLFHFSDFLFDAEKQLAFSGGAYFHKVVFLNLGILVLV